MKPTETVDYNIKTAWHAIQRMYNAEAAKHNSTIAVGFVLLNIDAQLGTPATKIAPMIGLETRSLTRMLKNLEDNGIIYRANDQYDKRLVRIFLTEKGKEKREAARDTVLKFNHRIRERIPEEKLSIFFEVMNEILLSTGNGKNEIA
jgi:DNA-binding MarR family transcriptional regulator